MFGRRGGRSMGDASSQRLLQAAEPRDSQPTLRNRKRTVVHRSHCRIGASAADSPARSATNAASSRSQGGLMAS